MAIASLTLGSSQCPQQDDNYHRTTPHTVDIRGKYWRCPQNTDKCYELNTSHFLWLDGNVKGEKVIEFVFITLKQ